MAKRRQTAKYKAWKRDWFNQWRKTTEKGKAYRRRYMTRLRKTKKGKERLRLQTARYRKTEKGRATFRRMLFRRRSRMLLVLNTLTATEWSQILRDDGYRCHWCRVQFTKGNAATQDHVIPVSKGGHHTRENVVAACNSCNASKCAMDAAEWQRSRRKQANRESVRLSGPLLP
jgi:5-methylcytosine-specific restriction endonuclease McrA